MAVTTTVQDVVDGAIPRSKKNVSGIISDAPTELVNLVTRAHRGLYSVAARVNPTYFAMTADQAFSTDHWPYPDDAECLFRLEQPDGTEVIVVPVADRAADAARPAVYFLGKKFYSAGNANDPTSGNLTMYYAYAPAAYAALADTLDGLWDEAYNELLELEVAIYLAIKDVSSNRVAELGALKEERDDWARRFIMHLEHAVTPEVRRFANLQVFNSPSLVPLGQLFAGGAKVAA